MINATENGTCLLTQSINQSIHGKQDKARAHAKPLAGMMSGRMQEPESANHKGSDPCACQSISAFMKQPHTPPHPTPLPIISCEGFPRDTK